MARHLQDTNTPQKKQTSSLKRATVESFVGNDDAQQVRRGGYLDFCSYIYVTKASHVLSPSSNNDDAIFPLLWLYSPLLNTQNGFPSSIASISMEAKVADSTRFNVSWCWWLVMLIIGVLVFAAGLLSLLNKLHRSGSAHLPTRPTNVVQNYATALELALQFFDTQKSGKIQNNRVSWRGDSGLRDGSEANLDLSKGMYDAGDLMKFGFPMAFTATVLSWAILEYGDHMNAVKQLEYAQGTLKWITDYLINAHPFPDVLYIQVGDPEVDHNCWERPETMTEERLLTLVNSSFPGTDIVSETAAALAAASLVYKGINLTYSDILLSHAQQLFTFADTYRGFLQRQHSASAEILQLFRIWLRTFVGRQLALSCN